MEDEQITSVFDNAQEVLENVSSVDEQTKPTKEEPACPYVTALEWNDYILAKFNKDELADGKYPTLDGLRRVTELVFGPITRRSIKFLNPPAKADGISTICVHIEVEVKNAVYNDLFPLANGINYSVIPNSRILEEEGVADCCKENTDKPYCFYLSATAESRAEARALRKLLRLHNTVAAEELASPKTIEQAEKNIQNAVGEWEMDELITDEQINLIDILASRCDANVLDVLALGKIKYNSSNIKQIPKSVAINILSYLNDLVRGQKEKLSSVRTYSPEWKTNL